MPAIDITTTQNVTIEYELAPLRERMLAFFLDALIILIGYILFIQLVLLVFSDRLFNGDFGWLILLFILPYAALFAYNLLFEILNVGQTPGKMAMSIKTVRLDGRDPEWSDVLLRALLHLVDSIFSAGVIGSLLIKISAKSQRFGDMAAGTTVIKLPVGQYFKYFFARNVSASVPAGARVARNGYDFHQKCPHAVGAPPQSGASGGH
jgi:uncharacterized RDD family membrane protein YckC